MLLPQGEGGFRGLGERLILLCLHDTIELPICSSVGIIVLLELLIFNINFCDCSFRNAALATGPSPLGR